MSTDTNHITDLGRYPTLDAVWVAHPEGGRPGDYLTIYDTEYHWDAVSRQWVSDDAESTTPSSTIDQLLTAVNNIRTAVSSLQDAIAGKAGVGVDGRVSSPARVTMRWMGATLDGETVTSMSNGDIWFDETTGEVKTLVSNMIRSLGTPNPDLVYCSQITGKLYRWNVIEWKRVGNDVTDSLDSNKRDSGLSARQGMLLNIALTNLTASVQGLTDKVNNSIIGDRALSRVVIDKMDYVPENGVIVGDNITPVPGGGYTTDSMYASWPNDMGSRTWSLRYAPTTKKLYYFYKVTNGELTEIRCSIIDPDPQMIYWDASDPTNERVMRWDQGNLVWIYNSTYATVSDMETALSLKADIDDVYTKEEVYSKDELDAAFDAAVSENDISDAFSSIEGALHGPAEEQTPS